MFSGRVMALLRRVRSVGSCAVCGAAQWRVVNSRDLNGCASLLRISLTQARLLRGAVRVLPADRCAVGER